MGFDIKRFKDARKAMGLTQQKLSDLLHISRGSIAMWETGKNVPPADMLEQLSEIFNCSIDYLLGKSDIRIDDDLLDEVNTISNKMLEEYGNVYDAKIAFYADSTPEERELILIYRDLNDIGQSALIGTARGLAANPDMKKASELDAETTA